ncbi:MAG TPA: rhodanese-like domain-containing protein [Methylomirabilota bacterium]|jgi:rhodanese-related sulfurtransferase|nr:rhodanese-like domain-containing protein [Methylomirabilota bacterium]
MPEKMTAAALKSLLDAQGTCALIDVREPGEYNDAHIPGASLVPRRQLEYRMIRLVPFAGTQVIVCDDDGRRAPLAAATLERMGFRRVAVLEGGINRWSTDGHPTEWGVNVPSKDFGEKIQVVHHVPEMHPEELHALQQKGEKIVLLDSRTPEEHRRATIPGGRSAPNGEVALHIADLAPDPDATIVVHCAGRTRSIIGARLLQRMGYPKVFDLRNGTMGWMMAGLELETGSTRLELPAPSPAARAAAEAFATRIGAEDGVRTLSMAALRELMAKAQSENVYLIDVRTSDEYARGYIPGFQWFPGGQAVQRSDDLVAVKNGHVVFACDGRVRSTIAASWYRQMGFPNVYVADGGVPAWAASGQALAKSDAPGGPRGYDEGIAGAMPAGYDAAKAQVEHLTPAALDERRKGPQAPAVIFVDTSREFSNGHVPGARWVPRGWLELTIADTAPAKDAPLVVTCASGPSAVLAGAALKGLGYQRVAALAEGMQGWVRAGLPVEKGLSGVMNPPNDVLTMGTDRTWAEAIQYLRWEEELGKKYGVH